LTHGIGESVREIHAGRRGAVACDRPATGDAAGRNLIPRDARGRVLAHAFAGRRGLKDFQARRRSAKRAGHIELVAWPASAPAEDPSRMCGTNCRDVDDERARRRRDIASDERALRGGRFRRDAFDQFVELVERQSRRKAQ
jgi:hypothetical protein